jgi:hypothetical protein
MLTALARRKSLIRMLAFAVDLDHDVTVADALDRREHERLRARLNARIRRQRRPDRARRWIDGR